MSIETLLAISAGVTFLLAIAAFWAIYQNYQLNKRERKERLLNEILEWGLEVSKFLHTWREARFVSMLSYEDKKTAHIDWLESLNNLEVRGAYIRKIAQPFGTNLRVAAEKAVNDLNENIRLFEEWLNDKVSWETAIKQKSAFNQSVNKLIKEATRIKTGVKERGEENMSNEDKTTVDKQTTLKGINDHLKRQDRQTKRMIYFAGAAFGASIILVAISLWIGRLVLSTTAFFWEYIFLVAIGFGFMCWCWWKQSKVK